jgi:hypothetical protein
MNEKIKKEEKFGGDKKKREDFLDLLEDKLIEVSKFFLEKSISVFIKNKVIEVEKKIEEQVEKKIKKVINNFLQFIFLLVGSLFVFYGGFLLLVEKLGFLEYANIIFGSIFLFLFLILRVKK